MCSPDAHIALFLEEHLRYLINSVTSKVGFGTGTRGEDCEGRNRPLSNVTERISLTKSADGRVATGAAWLKGKTSYKEKTKDKTVLDTNGPSHGRDVDRQVATSHKRNSG